MKSVKTIQLPTNPSIPVISDKPNLENTSTNKPFGEKADTYVRAPIYEGITSGKIVKLNKTLDAGNSYLTVRIAIIKPSKRLEITTAKNKSTVLIKSVDTSHEFKKRDKFFDKSANRQNK